MAVKSGASGVPYRVLIGINLPPDIRLEPGEITELIPASNVADFLETGVIATVKPAAKSKPKGDA